MIAFKEKTEQAADVGSRMLLTRANRCNCEEELALCREGVVPTTIIRTALFGLVRERERERGRRGYIDRELLAHWHRCDVRYSGQRLHRSDEDIWMHVLHLACQQDLSDQNGSIQFTARSFLRAFRGTYRGAYAHFLRESLERMRATSVIIRTGSSFYAGGLIDRFEYDRASGRFVVFIDPKIAGLFGIETESLEPVPNQMAYRVGSSPPPYQSQSLTLSPLDRRSAL